jgi:hypothetical protein
MLTEKSMLISSLKERQKHYERIVQLNNILAEIRTENGPDCLRLMFGESYDDNILAYTLKVKDAQNNDYKLLLKLEKNEK